MDIIKKNLVLFIVLTLTLIASVVLVAFVFIGHGEMLAAMEKVETIKKDIKSVQRQRPKPHKANLIRIEKDIEVYQKNINELYHFFGQPYRQAFLMYITALGLNEKTFMEKFNEFWQQNNIPGSNEHQLFNKFNRDFDSLKLRKAREIFQQLYQEQTIERVNESNLNELIMYAIGIPRSMSQEKCKSYLALMQEDLLKLLKKNKVIIAEGVSSFSLGSYITGLPKEEDVPYIIDNFVIIGDVFKRIIAAGIKQVEYVGRGDLRGTVEDKFTRYRVSIEVVSTEKNLMKFVNLLSKAYESRRIYVVRNMVLEKTIDKALELTSERPSYLKNLNNDNRAGGLMPNGMPQPDMGMPGQPVAPRREVVKKVVEKPKGPFYKQKSYGKILIGGSKQCKLLVELDYIVYNRQKFTIQE